MVGSKSEAGGDIDILGTTIESVFNFWALFDFVKVKKLIFIAQYPIYCFISPSSIEFGANKDLARKFAILAGFTF